MATVLYVDDEEAIRRAVRGWLTRKGHVVHEAGSLAAARAAVLSHPDLQGVFIDLRLGEESGLALFEWLEQQRPALASRVAFVTGGDEELPAVPHPGAHPVIGKPFEMRSLEAQAAAWDAAGT